MCSYFHYKCCIIIRSSQKQLIRCKSNTVQLTLVEQLSWKTQKNILRVTLHFQTQFSVVHSSSWLSRSMKRNKKLICGVYNGQVQHTTAVAWSRRMAEDDITFPDGVWERWILWGSDSFLTVLKGLGEGRPCKCKRQPREMLRIFRRCRWCSVNAGTSNFKCATETGITCIHPNCICQIVAISIVERRNLFRVHAMRHIDFFTTNFSTTSFFYSESPSFFTGYSMKEAFEL